MATLSCLVQDLETAPLIGLLEEEALLLAQGTMIVIYFMVVAIIVIIYLNPVVNLEFFLNTAATAH